MWQVDLPYEEWEEYLEQGLNCMEEEKYEKALEYFQKAILLAPEEAEIYYYMGYLFTIEKDYERAIESYESALRLAKKELENQKVKGPWWANSHTHLYLKTLRALGMIHYRLKNVDEAIAIFTQILNLNPQDSLEVREVLVESYLRKGDYAPVLEIYELVEQAFSEELEEYSQALEEEEKYYQALFSQYWKDPKAEKEFFHLLRDEYRRVMGREALNSVALYNLGLACFFEGKREEAKRRWEKALSQNPYVYYFMKKKELPPHLKERDCPARWQAKEYVERFGDFWEVHPEALSFLEELFCDRD